MMLMKRIVLLVLIFASIIGGVQAQIDPLYAQYLSNPLVINPAYTGLNNNFTASVAFRKQWAGYEGNPTTLNASAHSSIFQQKMGVGFIAVQDNIGASKNTEVNVTYAYKIDLGQSRISLGLQGGMVNYRSNSDNLNPYDPGTWQANQNITKTNLGAGMILSSERYFIGISSPRMLPEKASVGTSSVSIYKQHLYGMAAYIFILSERIKFKPSVLVKSVQGAPISADLNTSFIIDDKYTAGLFTRNINTYGLLLQARMDQGYRFSYIFEVPSNKSVGVRYPTHEVCVGISLALLKSHHNSFSNF
jgi:type IX secretion system PorP/SprF family membrane protein